MNISKDQHYITLISVFKVDPADQQQLVNLLTVATQKSIKKLPGFLSSALHKSVDGNKVTMYAQWEKIEDYQQCTTIRRWLLTWLLS